MRKATYFVDLDGVILKHLGEGSCAQWDPNNAELCEGVTKWFDAHEKNGDCIVITTARKECTRPETETVLRALGLFWDQLVMGITSGNRIIINDCTTIYKTKAITLERNEGLGGVK